MADIYLDWGGGFEFGPSNDLRIAEGTTFTDQRVLRGLLSGPVVKDDAGVVVQRADNLFAQEHGAGLGRDVDGIDDQQTRADRAARVRTYMMNEPVVDQGQPIDVSFGSDAEQGISFMLIKYQSIEGDPSAIGLKQ